MREITSAQFDQVRETMLQHEAATKKVSISSIRVHEHSFKNRTIEVDGIEVKVAGQFFTRFAGLLKMNTSLTKEFIKNEDGKVAAAFINALSEYRREVKAKDILLIANRQTREVIDICDPKRWGRLTHDSLFDITQKIINEQPSLIIETIDHSPSDGTIAINLLNNKEIGFPGAGKDEFFKFGFSIQQTRKATIVESYNTRLVCSNGMRTSLGKGAIGGNSSLHFEERFKLNGTGGEDIRIFLNKISEMQRADFVPSSFASALTSAVQTGASLAEVESAMRLAQYKVDEVDHQYKKDFIDTIERNWFHGYGEARSRIVQKGHDLSNISDRQKQFIKTGQSVWDVVNSLTYLGSNNSGIELLDKWQLKEAAGRLFAKSTGDGFDMSFNHWANL
jgi:hypothetical protein